MYAVFQNGGKQYLVQKGDVIRLEKLNIKIENNIEFNNIIIINNNGKTQIGSPFITDAKIIAKIILHGRNNKISIIKSNRRKHYRKHQGHRQYFTDVKIMDIFNL